MSTIERVEALKEFGNARCVAAFPNHVCMIAVRLLRSEAVEQSVAARGNQRLLTASFRWV